MSGRQTGRIAFFFCAGFEVKSSRGRVCSFAWGLVTHSAAVSWLQLSYFGDLSNTIQTHVNLLSTLTMSTSSHPTSTESSARADSPRGGLALRPATRSRLGASAGRTMAEELRDQLAAALEAKRADGALTQQEAELLRTLTHPPLPREWLAGSQARVDEGPCRFGPGPRGKAAHQRRPKAKAAARAKATPGTERPTPRPRSESWHSSCSCMATSLSARGRRRRRKF